MHTNWVTLAKGRVVPFRRWRAYADSRGDIRAPDQAVLPHDRVVLDTYGGESVEDAQRCHNRARIAHHEPARIDLTFDAVIEANPQSVICQRAR